ncbi:MAG: hypothetical protein IPH78_14910 [Bacteroidetes bacterium]|nr:hypothetical protein [Bacteroidota bacterium]
MGSTGAYDVAYNEISDCYIERVGTVVHPGHGYTVFNYDNDPNNNMGKTRYNSIKNCTSVAIRTLFHLRGKETESNHFSACTSFAGGNETGAIAVTDAKYNTFDKIETNVYKDECIRLLFSLPCYLLQKSRLFTGVSAIGSRK